VDWVQLEQDEAQSLLNTAMNFGSYEDEEFLDPAE
jgi:hypothetical protein